jgi:hypothetical protein
MRKRQNGFVFLKEREMVDWSEAAPRKRLRRFLVVAGPGLVVMLVASAAGSIVTAAQSGAGWGYRLLWLQFALMTELAGLAGVGALLNLPASVTMILVVGALLLMAYPPL